MIIVDSPITGKREILTQSEFNSYMAQTNGAVLKWIVSPVLKHGTHEQKDHGNWSTGVALDPAVAASIIERVRENGGLSVNMVDGSEPTTGFMVAKGSQFGRIVKADDFYDAERGPEILFQYMKSNKSDLATGKNYLGLWHNKADGQVYLDVSENIQDRERAISVGVKRDQISIWDVVNFAEIETGGTGNVGKRRDSGIGDSKQHSRYDGRRVERIRKSSLGEDGETQVIRFAFGLKPVLKHEGGEGHDQKTHGNWATGESSTEGGLSGRLKREGFSDEEIRRITNFEGVGPSLSDLDLIAEGTRFAEDEELAEFVSNDGEQYDAMTEYANLDSNVTDRIEDFESKEGRPATDQERANFYAEEEEAAIAMFVRDNRNTLNDLRNEQEGIGQSAESYVDSFGEVFNSRITVTEDDGNEYDMYTKTQNVSTSSEGITVQGEVYADGMSIGRFERLFFKEGDTWNVEHKWFDVEDEYKGKGFGKDFIRNSMDYYTAQGMGYVKILTGLEDGARHWARMGFDWDPQYVDWNMRAMRNAYRASESSLSEEGKKEFESIYSRGYNETQGKAKDPLADDFPFPAEFATIGWDRRTKDSSGEWNWDGKSLMAYKNFQYAMPLTAEGRNLLTGPIDRDGDGLVYDGTVRERPTKNN